MDKSIRIVFFFLAFILLFVTCDNYEFPESAYPRIETLPVTGVSGKTLTFKANVVQPGKRPIINHGFIWGTTESLSLALDEKVELGSLSGKNSFEVNLTSGFYEGETYFVKAFVATDDYLVYGKSVAFTSQGSNPPVIQSLEPTEGTWGDTIMLRGKYFSFLNKNNVVLFGNFKSTVISSSDTTIRCIVPNDIPQKNLPIHLTVTGQETKSATNFTMISPVVESFLPQTGTFEDVITIKGTQFSSNKETNIVKFNEHIAQVIEASRTQLKVKVPAAINAKSNVVSVTVNLQSANANGSFLILPPAVSSISNNKGFMQSTLQISGNNFNPSLTGNRVLLAGVEANVLSASKSSIMITVPDGIYKSRSFPVEVVVAEQSATSQELFTLQDKWIRKADVPHGTDGRYGAVAFSIGGFGYVGLGGGNVGNKFWQYNPAENTWKEVAPFPGGQRAGAASFVIGDHAYVGLGGGTNNFWRYDSQANSWTPIADLPFGSEEAKGFSVNGKGYIVRIEETDNFWKYDPATDSWAAMPDHPTYYDTDGYGFMRPDAGFTIDNRLFVYSADNSTGPNQFMEFAFGSNQWIQRAAAEDGNIDMWTTGFSVGGNGYIRGKWFLHKYDPASDAWTTNYEELLSERSLAIAFVVDGKAYFGTSFEGAYDMWEFDPEFD